MTNFLLRMTTTGIVMPWAAKRPCLQPGCPELVVRGRCAKHSRKMERTRSKQRGPRLYDTARWKRSRLMALARQLVCQADGCNRSAIDVDHVVSVEAGGAQYSYDNVQCLCHSCHSRKTAMYDGSFGRAKVDTDKEQG